MELVRLLFALLFLFTFFSRCFYQLMDRFLENNLGKVHSDKEIVIKKFEMSVIIVMWIYFLNRGFW